MTTDKFKQLGHHIEGRIEVVAALNDYLSRHPGFLGFISWWGVNKFVKEQLAINQRMLNERSEEIAKILR